MSKTISFLLVFLFIGFSTYAQNTYDIKHPGNSMSSICGECQSLFAQMPSEVMHGFQTTEDGYIYFYMSNVDWFNTIISKNSDGLAVDIVMKDDYACDEDKFEWRSWASKGKLLPPVYFKQIKSEARVTELGEVVVPMGKLPKSYLDQEIELNLIVLIKKNMCYYQTYYNLPRVKWDLLDMGMFTDQLIFKNKPADTLQQSTDKATSILNRKKMTFVVPFEQGKTEYSDEDIAALADSLNLNTYDIMSASVHAYSSVEGNTAFNLELQQKRAESIINGLQELQSVEIEYDISSSENWTEFYQDVVGTVHRKLADKSKSEVKNALSDKKTATELESILKNHRKAVIQFAFEKKSNFRQITDEQLILEFGKATKSDDHELAQQLMAEAYERIVGKNSPSTLLGDLEVPDSKEYVDLRNSKKVYDYFLDEADMYATYKDLLQLVEIMPKSKEINYNLMALKFQVWITGKEEVDHEAFYREIGQLKSLGIEQSLVNRMQVNYHIILSEFYMQQRMYDEKDKQLKKIYYKYKNVKNTNEDLLQIAQYFSAYGEYDWAVKLLKPHVLKVDTDEDLLFYYINLTISDDDLIKTSSHANIMLNAIEMNTERFCQIFNSSREDGVSFQLLENADLKKYYCEECTK